MVTRKNRKSNKLNKKFRKTRSKRQRGGGKEENDELIRVSFKGNIAKVDELLNKGADVNAKNKLGNTALINASMTGHTETVARLLEKGAGVNANNNNGHTALILAIWSGHTETVELLNNEIRHEKHKVARLITERGKRNDGTDLAPAAKREIASMIGKIGGRKRRTKRERDNN